MLGTLAVVLQAYMPAPVAPPMVAGIVDARSQLVIVAGDDGTLDAVELETGKRRWSSATGRWPLVAGLSAVAVAAPDSAKANVLHLRLLDLVDGRQKAAAAPLVLPAWVIVSPERAVAIRGGGSFSVAGWAPIPSRQPDRVPLRGAWRVRWEAARIPVYGYRLPNPGEGDRAAGMILLDPVTAATQPAPIEAPSDAPPTPPSGSVPDRRVSYWSWSDHGSAWTDTPRVFRVTAGVWAFLSIESGGARRLSLHRFRPGEQLTTVTLQQDGTNTYPVVSEDGRYLLLIKEDPNKAAVMNLHDLARGGSRRAERLPPLPVGFRPQIAVIGSLLFYVVERSSAQRGGGARIDRTLIALDWTSGRERWSHGLAPRLVAPPVPGSLPR